MLRGRWSEAEQEARQACEELERFGLLDAVGYAQYEVGEVRLRMGDLDAAAEAFERAYEYGHDAQPGMALLHLARGEIDEADTLDRTRARGDGRGRAEPPTEPRGPACSRPRSTSRWRPATSRRPAQRSTSWSRSPPTSSDPCSKPARSRRAASCSSARIDRRRRRRSWADRGGCGRRRTCPTRAPGRASAMPKRWPPKATRRRLAGTCGRHAACSSGSARGSTLHGSTRSWEREAAVAGPWHATGDQDLHVHRHRHLHRPRRADRRRRLGRAAADGTTGSCDPRSRTTAARRSSAPATGSSSLSSEPPTASSARSTSSAGWRGTAASTGSRPRSASVSTPPRHRARAATTRAAACTSPRASARPRRRRGDPRLERDARRDGLGPLRAVRPAPAHAQGRRRARRGPQRRLAVAGGFVRSAAANVDIRPSVAAAPRASTPRRRPSLRRHMRSPRCPDPSSQPRWSPCSSWRRAVPRRSHHHRFRQRVPLRPRHHPASRRPASAPPSVAPTRALRPPDATPKPPPAQVPPDFTAAERYLLDGVRRGATDCEPAGGSDDLPRDAIAGIECDSDDPARGPHRLLPLRERRRHARRLLLPDERRRRGTRLGYVLRRRGRGRLHAGRGRSSRAGMAASSTTRVLPTTERPCRERMCTSASSVVRATRAPWMPSRGGSTRMYPGPPRSGANPADARGAASRPADEPGASRVKHVVTMLG